MNSPRLACMGEAAVDNESVDKARQARTDSIIKTTILMRVPQLPLKD